jgi:hypothetical protein
MFESILWGSGPLLGEKSPIFWIKTKKLDSIELE